jgi:hypothetical protein
MVDLMKELVDLASRKTGGIEVALIWNRRSRSLVVFAHDAATSEELAIPVSGDEAADVYRHPFAYAHRATAAASTATKPGRRKKASGPAWRTPPAPGPLT